MVLEILIIFSFFLAIREERSESQIQNRVDPNYITSVRIVAIAVTRFSQWRFLGIMRMFMSKTFFRRRRSLRACG